VAVAVTVLRPVGFMENYLEGALVDPQISSDLSDRFPSLGHDPHRTGAELLVELLPLLWHDYSL